MVRYNYEKWPYEPTFVFISKLSINLSINKLQLSKYFIMLYTNDKLSKH